MSAAVAEQPIVIAQPGVYDMPHDVYLADPVPGGSLSNSGAKLLLPPNCPAMFKHYQENRRPDKASFDFGHAAHMMVLGVGAEIIAVDAADWRTKAAQEQRDAIRAAGKTPLLAADVAVVKAMTAALREHPIASALLDPEAGTAEASLFWNDDPTGIWRRARLDWLPEPHDGRLIVPDFKTAVSANPAKFARSAADYSYHQQAAWYCDAVTALGYSDDPAFLFIVQEKTPPYLVSIVQLDATALRIGRRLNRDAIDTYIECRRTGEWPGYADDVALVSLPAWYERQFEEQ